MEQPSQREQHLQADADSARQQSYNMTIEARQEKAKADRLRTVNAKLVKCLERIVGALNVPAASQLANVKELARMAVEETEHGR